MSVRPDKESGPEESGLAGSGLLHDFFEHAARRWPERVAVDIPPGGQRPARTLVTYAELEAASNALAEPLRPLLQEESVVGILLPRTSPHLYSAQLAVLKAGAAYTCLDPSFPDERIQAILEDANATVLLTDCAGRLRVRHPELESLACMEIAVLLAGCFSSDQTPKQRLLAFRPVPENLAYVIYTSGSTGQPKGVMIEHRSISNLVASDLETFQLSTSDRIAQGSSAAYDSSIEELYLALAAGATVVVMDDETARSGPDLIPWLRRERITVFCPPPTLLRATGCTDPNVALPDLKLLYVGGEALPRDVADRWSQGRTLINGYGPTECAVTCLRDRVEADQPITIGRPVRGVKAWVLNEALEEVPPGEPGELCIGGLGLARGYWNRPDLTAEKFITHPSYGRIYRTGDLVHRDAAGQFFYHGRMDAQIKLRGYRIELGEIEARLAGCAGVRAAACQVQEENGQATLVAFVVPEHVTHAPSPDDLQTTLRKGLPSYMIPGRIGFLTALPTTVGGKLNRAALPHLPGVERPHDQVQALPRTPLEAKIQAGFASILRCPEAISIQNDFFNDLGGDSLSAAQLITVLREDPATAWVTVRDLYEARTVAALAERAPDRPEAATQPMTHPRVGGGTRTPPRRLWAAMLLQSGWLLKKLIIGSGLTYLAVFQILPALTARLGMISILLLAPPAVLAGLLVYTPLSVVYAAWVKKLLIGRYRPRMAPVWSGFYLRNWLVQQTVKLVPWWLIEGTEFQNAALRALGAQIGRRVHIHRGVDLLRGGWDLLNIGDDVTISQDVALGLVELEAGQIVLGTISLGNSSTLETHCYVGAGTRIESNGFLAARSSLASGGRIPAGECWDGIPACPAGAAPEPPPLPRGESVLSPGAAGLWLVLSRLSLAAAVAVPLELSALGLAWVLGAESKTAAAWLVVPTINARLLWACVVAAVLSVPLLLLVEALACRVMGGVRPGVMSRWSPGYVRVWLKAGLVDSGSRWLYGTLFWPIWLRWAGMRVGQGCEISSLIDTVPELVEIGDRTFCADGLYLGGARIHRGTVTLAMTCLGRNNFLGNGAIIPGGTRLPDDVLLGVCTVADASLIRPGTAWFGHPGFELPRREVVALDRRLTHHPSATRYLVRVFWELLRFALPTAGALIAPLWYAGLTTAEGAVSLTVLLLAAIPLLNLGAMAARTGLIILLKWTLLGRVRPGVHPLWSSWASRWDFVCLAWNLYTTEVVTALDGTPGLPWLLRAMGMRVGRDVVLGGGFAEDLPDPDMLLIEEGATVVGLFQAHTFEDRVLKTDYVFIRKDASVGRNSVLLYGAEIGAGTRVAPNSVVMKHEHLLPGLCYEGVPTRARNDERADGGPG